MSVFSLLLLATLGGGTGPATADAGRAAARNYVATYSVAYLARAHARIPAWARKYNMNCSGCHYPAPPRLNATGQRFKWAGYRMPEEIGEAPNVDKLQNYVAGHAVTQFEWNKTAGQPANNTFAVPEIGLFMAGPFTKAFSGFLEFQRLPDGTTDAAATLLGMWGKQGAYRGFRIGQMHAINEWGVAGFDRNIGAQDIAPLGTVTAAIPFSFDMAVGAEAFMVRGSNRLSLQITNGIDRDGGVTPGGPGPSKDVALIDQLLYDNAGSGVEAVAYYGTLQGLDTATAPTLKSHFWRFAFSANKISGNVEVLGGAVYGKDLDLPASLGFTNNADKGLGWWVSGQYYVPTTPLVLFARFESVRPNTDVSNNSVRYFDAGTVLPINLPQYLRATLDYRLTSPQGGVKTNDLIAEMQFNF